MKRIILLCAVVLSVFVLIFASFPNAVGYQTIKPTFLSKARESSSGRRDNREFDKLLDERTNWRLKVQSLTEHLKMRKTDNHWYPGKYLLALFILFLEIYIPFWRDAFEQGYWFPGFCILSLLLLPFLPFLVWFIIMITM